MKYIGAHVSASPDVSVAPAEAAALGATAFSLFTAPENRWRAPAPTEDVCARFREECARLGFSAAQILPHAGFLINLGSPDKRKLALSRLAFTDELNRCAMLGLTMINFHPGASLKAMDDEACLSQIAESINICLDKTSGVKAVIENTAGQGSNLGWDFGQIAYIIDRVEDKTRVGVCVDTCHAYAAGYDFSTPEAYQRSWEIFDSTIGREYLCGMHLNDAARGVGSRIDRHASIGAGNIGHEFFRRLMADPRTDGIPLILETPDPGLWSQEIRTLYGYSARPTAGQ